ncbi:MAG: hypothetical protein AAGI30_04540 [Planctomycetota bacterium]
MGERPRVVLVGHCGADSGGLRRAVERAVPHAEVRAANDDASLDAELPYAGLLLVNRVLDGRFRHRLGVDLMRERADAPAWILISNYDDAQQDAEAAGAGPGFGKRGLNSATTAGALRSALGITSEPC